MRLGIFEDHGVERLEPITLTRPAWGIRCGAATLLERQTRALGATEVGAWVRPALVDLARFEYPGMAVNDPSWRTGLWTNARWLPPVMPRIDRTTPHVGLVGQSVAYIVTPHAAEPAEGVEDWLEQCRRQLPTVNAQGVMIDHLWDAVDRNGDALCQDWEWFHAEHHSGTGQSLAVLGPAERLVVAAGSHIEPFVTADTRGGPVLIDRGAVVHSFTRLEGPCYVGVDAWVLGAKIRAGTSIGPRCRVGGEVEASVLLANSNKYHEGFLGHSYVGEWVNLAAATQTSDLRNDYGMVRVTIHGKRMPTGRTKIGSYIGDHTKTGLGALLNTGSVIGAFCNLLPSGSLLPQVVPSFCQVQMGAVQERFDLTQLFATATTVMKRRGVDFSDVHREFFISLYEQTAPLRRKALREAEMRRLRKSV